MLIEVYLDLVGETLTVWFGEPQTESICQETGDEVILMKDKEGKVIGFEKLNYRPSKTEKLRMVFETMPVI